MRRRSSSGSAAVSAVQLGFIAGTLLVGVLRLADRLPPARLFLLSAVLGSLANAALLLPGPGLERVLLLRFATGLCLAGIYSVGMKIAADYFERGLGLALGWQVGALVLGTALPHLLRLLATGPAWPAVVLG
ncbi:MAG: MFS transporter, partial [Bacteroidota bacterium]|nr:MFS transporter [Bacteroidota bacterium]